MMDNLLKLVANPYTAVVTPLYRPIEREDGLYYGMQINGEDYRWVVSDTPDGRDCVMVSNAKINSLQEVIDRFKRQFVWKG